MKIYEKMKSYMDSSECCINLIASENVLPQIAKIPYTTDIFNRYVFKSEKELYFSGREELYQLELECCNIVGELLSVHYVSLKPISGLNAMACVIALFTKPGDVIYSISPENGGHHVTRYMLQNMGRKSCYLPFNSQTQKVDLDALEQEIKAQEVSMVYIDLMNVLHDVNVSEIKGILSPKTCLIYDASHVMALIMGKCYQNPLKQGADILVGTTHKTLPGPHKAIFATDNPILYRMFELRNGSFISSQHPADVFALGILLESLQANMKMYSKQIIDNARYFAEILSMYGLPVVKLRDTYTDTHQIWIGDNEIDVYPFIDKLMKYKIITNGLKIPYINNYGIRIGIQEVTFCGFKSNDIKKLGECIGNLYNGNDDGIKEIIQNLIEKLDETTYLENKF